MKIAVLGPISTRSVAPFLSEEIPDDFPEGYTGAPFMKTLIGELLAKGHDVFAITCGGYVAKTDSKPLSLKGNRFEFHCCPNRLHSIRPSSRRLGYIVDFFAYERRNMTSVLARVQPDVIHAHWTYEFAMAAMGSGIPYLVTAHDDPVHVLKLYKNVYRFGRYLMARRVLKGAKAISAVSDDLKRRISGLATQEIHVVPNPLGRDFIDAGMRRTPRSISTEQVLITAINGWGYLKNVDSALIAFSHIRRKLHTATYHLYGSGFEPGGCAAQWAIDHGVAEGVVFHGAVPHGELLHALDTATLMLHPSRSESCPMGIAEALAMGVPVVGGMHSGGVPAMVGEAGLLVDINKPIDIAQAALRLLTDDELYEACAARALEQIKKFAPELIATQYEAIYKSVLN